MFVGKKKGKYLAVREVAPAAVLIFEPEGFPAELNDVTGSRRIKTSDSVSQMFQSLEF